MTKKEYVALYRQARKQTALMTAKTMTELKRTYKEAGELVAEAIKSAELAGTSDKLLLSSWQTIERQLADGADKLAKALSDDLPLRMGDVAAKASTIDETWLSDCFKDAGLSSVGIKNAFVAVNEDVVRATIERTWQDGYTFSQRIWKVGDGYQEDIRRVITSGLAQGRDPVKIAGDVQAFIADGKPRLMKRYGKLKADTARFVRRIPTNVDYRAMRLVRTELYASLKEAGRQAGMANPGCTGEFDWVMEAGRAHWDCSCPDLADGSPYTADTIPAQPHPNCMCYVQPRLRDRREFVEDLKTWAEGGDVAYLDEWKDKYYD